ncbi:hypothetical protein ATANTOWER_023301 [Ataeniobius toweri]|uniref:Uncharacterized protein n=1 Tax=Ataeniobius toweri TaxID=208326 RepID=A0ABU7BC26_9TELE|nr:hypothetical protein [Ataeniobius toweri]
MREKAKGNEYFTKYCMNMKGSFSVMRTTFEFLHISEVLHIGNEGRIFRHTDLKVNDANSWMCSLLFFYPSLRTISTDKIGNRALWSEEHGEPGGRASNSLFVGCGTK